MTEGSIGITASSSLSWTASLSRGLSSKEPLPKEARAVATVMKFVDWTPAKAMLAELIGTFFLTLTALLSGSPFATALTLTALVYAIGNTSGCHVNPAVTLGLVAARRLAVGIGVFYVLAQLAGAVFAGLVANRVGQPPTEYHAGSAFAELIGFGFLMVIVAAVSDKHVPKAGSGIAIGAALAAALVTTQGILNPAIALAMGQALSGATWAPVVGGVLFSALFTTLSSPETSSKSAEESKEVPEEPAEPATLPAEARKPRWSGWLTHH